MSALVPVMISTANLMHCCATVVVNTRNELIICSLLGFVMNQVMLITLHTCSTINLPLWRFALYCPHRSRCGTVIKHSYSVYTVRNHTSGVRGYCSTTDEMPLWLLYNISLMEL